MGIMKKCRKGMAAILSVAMVLGMMPGMSDNVTRVQADDEGKETKYLAYATKAQMIDKDGKIFTPDSDGNAAYVGKIKFGKNSEGKDQEWFILGKDSGIDGENTVIFTSGPIAKGQKFQEKTSSICVYDLKDYDYGTYDGYSPYYVNPNHYGVSDLRKALQSMTEEGNTNYFTEAENNLLQETPVVSADIRNGSRNYTTNDKLYVCTLGSTILCGSKNDKVLKSNRYWEPNTIKDDDSNIAWLRSPFKTDNEWCVFPDRKIKSDAPIDKPKTWASLAVCPASNINLSSVLFASSAQSATDDTVKSGIIEAGTAMTLRLDGSDLNLGTAIYNDSGVIKVLKGDTTDFVSFVVQGNTNGKDWYYSKQVTDDITTNILGDISQIANELNIELDDVDLSDCKVWLETTGEDGLIYAVPAEKYSTSYVSKDTIMMLDTNFITVKNDLAKIEFGKNGNRTSQNWYMMGKDDGIDGDNTIIFSAESYAVQQAFNSGTDEKVYKEGYGEYEGAAPEKVAPNNYGASELRTKLQSIINDSDYFSEQEAGLLNKTSVITETYSGQKYTISDELYIPYMDPNDTAINMLIMGSNNYASMLSWLYADSQSNFWLRTAAKDNLESAYYSNSNGINDNLQGVECLMGIRPVSNLNLSSVLFATSANSTETSDDVAGTITSGTAMKLRFDGYDKEIGSVTYNADTEIIKATKGKCQGNVMLVVQGNDGTNDWYYSKKIDDNDQIIVNVSDIKNALNTSADISLSDCHIWLETTEDDLIYAVNAKQLKSVTKIEATISTPKGEEELCTQAVCTTKGVAEASVDWKNSNGDSAGATANYYPEKYIASIIFTPADGYEFIKDDTSIVVNNQSLDGTINEDGSITVTTGEYESTKRKVISIIPPTTPTDGSFANYYTSDTILSDENTELGKTATLVFEGSKEPLTKDVNVSWYVWSDVIDGSTVTGQGYNEEFSAANNFEWYIVEGISDYELDHDNNVYLWGNVSIKNKAITPVTNAGKEASVNYNDSVIDVSNYFDIDENAGTASYELLEADSDGVTATGEGSLNGNLLTVTKLGTFKIKLSTEAHGYYDAGEAISTLTVENGLIEYEASEGDVTYDGQAHSIAVKVNRPSGAKITYSTDGKEYTNINPGYTDADEYKVFYKIEKENYDTITGYKTITISKKPVTITAKDQSITWGESISNDVKMVSTQDLINNDNIYKVSLEQGTTKLTDNGKINISEVIICNGDLADFKNVTKNYDITYVSGKLQIKHDTSLQPEKIEAQKDKTEYEAGDSMNIDDLIVKAFYKDGYSEEITGFITNVDKLDMKTVGKMSLNVSYTQNDKTVNCDVMINVKHTHNIDGTDKIGWKYKNGGTTHWKECISQYCDKSEGYKSNEAEHSYKYDFDWSDYYKTCTATRTCSVCGYSDSQTVNSTSKVIQNKTCTLSEKTTYTATFTNGAEVQTKVIDTAQATDHSYSEPTYKWNDNHTECTAKRICLVCKNEETETAKNSKVTSKIEQEKTCTLPELTTYTAKFINGVFKTQIAENVETAKAEGHTWNEDYTIDKAATCTEAGNKSIHCKNCNETKDYKEIDALGHDFAGDWTITKDVTCTENGNKTRKCSRCDEPETKIIKATGHLHTEVRNEKEATYDKEGYTGDTYCTDCDTKLSSGKVIEKLTKPTDDSEKEPLIGNKTGWEEIKADVINQIKNATATSEKITITIDMNTTSKIDGGVLDAIKGKNVDVVLDMGDGIAWTINGNSVISDSVADIDLGVNKNSDMIPVDIINTVTGERSSIQISLVHNGEFGFTATLSIGLEAKNAGYYANLFYYNVDAGKLEFMNAAKIDEEGNASLTFSHASDYSIVIADKIMDGNKDVEDDTSKDDISKDDKSDDGTGKKEENDKNIIDKGTDKKDVVDKDVSNKATANKVANATTTSDTSTKSSAKTGDNSLILLWVLVMIGAGSGVIAVAAKRRRQR